jgi:hypothetical protein
MKTRLTAALTIAALGHLCATSADAGIIVRRHWPVRVVRPRVVVRHPVVVTPRPRVVTVAPVVVSSPSPVELTRFTVDGHSTTTFDGSLTRGDTVRIAVDGSGAMLKVKLFNDAGQLVGEAAGRNPSLLFTPAQSRGFRIEVSNLGSAANACTVRVIH